MKQIKCHKPKAPYKIPHVSTCICGVTDWPLYVHLYGRISYLFTLLNYWGKFDLNKVQTAGTKSAGGTAKTLVILTLFLLGTCMQSNCGKLN